MKKAKIDNLINNLTNVEYLRLIWYIENGVDLQGVSEGIGLPLEATIKFLTEEYTFNRFRDLPSNKNFEIPQLSIL